MAQSGGIGLGLPKGRVPRGLSTARRVSVRAVQSTEGQKDGYCRSKQASTKRRDRESNDQPEGPEQRSGYHHSDDAREHQNDPHKSASIASTGIKQLVGIERALHPPNS